MSTSSWKLSLVAGVVSAVITAGILYVYGGMREREATALSAANQKLRTEIIARSDARAMASKKSPNTGASARSASRDVAQSSSRDGQTSLYRDEGQSTPVAALQTFAWACDRGDVEKVAQILAFEGSGRDKAVALMARLPGKLRAEWKTPEELAATIYVSNFMQRPFPAANVIDLAETEPVGPDRIQIRLPGSMLDKGNYLKTAEGWKFLIPEAAVDSYIAKNFRETAQQR